MYFRGQELNLTIETASFDVEAFLMSLSFDIQGADQLLVEFHANDFILPVDVRRLCHNLLFCLSLESLASCISINCSKFWNTLKSIGGSKGGSAMDPPPFSVQFLSFPCSFWQKHSNRFCPRLRGFRYATQLWEILDPPLKSMRNLAPRSSEAC